MPDEKKDPELIGVRLAFNHGDAQVGVTAHSVNGVEVINPLTAYISYDQWIEIACKLQLRQIAQRQNQLTTKTALIVGPNG